MFKIRSHSCWPPLLGYRWDIISRSDVIQYLKLLMDSMPIWCRWSCAFSSGPSNLVHDKAFKAKIIKTTNQDGRSPSWFHLTDVQGTTHRSSPVAVSHSIPKTLSDLLGFYFANRNPFFRVFSTIVSICFLRLVLFFFGIRPSNRRNFPPLWYPSSHLYWRSCTRYPVILCPCNPHGQFYDRTPGSILAKKSQARDSDRNRVSTNLEVCIYPGCVTWCHTLFWRPDDTGLR